MAIGFETFKKTLQGRFLRDRLYVLAEIVHTAFLMPSVKLKDYLDPQVSLTIFKKKAGIMAEDEPDPDLDKSSLRLIHKVLFLVKARGVDQVSRLLCYVSPDWEHRLLVPNANPPEGENPDPILGGLLSEKLGISSQGITLDYQPHNREMTTDTVKATGDKNKASVHGPLGRYRNHYCPVKIIEPAPHLQKACFKVGGTEYQWVALAELKDDDKVREKNFDVLEFLSHKYDSTLFHLPESFSERINTES